MNSIKSMIVTVTLLAVGYGANLFMNKPLGDPGFGESGTWDMASGNLNGALDSDAIPNRRPNIDLPPLQPAETGAQNPFSMTGTSNDSNPFANGNRPTTPESYANNAGSTQLPTANESKSALASLLPTAPAPANPTTQVVDSQPTFEPVPTQNSFANTPLLTAEPIVPPARQFPVEQASHAQPVTTPMTAPATVYTTNPADFDTYWNQAQTQLQAGELTTALQTLTKLYHLPLSSQDRDQVVAILDQLAANVVYSSEHFVLPAHTVQPGETLSTLAERYHVPADFLSRVNGLADAAPVTPGQELKVVEGPFRAELHLERREMTVFLGQHYAGRFNVAIGRDFPEGVSIFSVVEKAASRAYQDTRTGQVITAGSADSPIGNIWLGLHASPTSNSPNLGIHSVGSSINASDSRGCISVSREDADNLQAILSIGSQIAVR